MKYRCILLGKHSNRTPMAYKVYHSYFAKHIEYVQRIEDADFVILGFMENLNGLHNEINKALKKNSNLKVVVISEEPLWDTVSGGDFQKKFAQIDFDSSPISYINLNHVTSTIFDFDHIPYFLTTNNDMFARYGLLFSRNRVLSSHTVQQIWEKYSGKTVFLMQKRLEQLYSVEYPSADIWGLSQLRCEYALKNQGKKVEILGPGWDNQGPRQDLPDWHLDKLRMFDQKTNRMSALENTHIYNYITEKIFDAFAMCAIPIYYAAKQHKVFSIVESESFINLYGDKINWPISSLLPLNADTNFIERYMYTQNLFATLFSNPFYLHLERYRVVQAIITELDQLYIDR